jgi:hypothetical protein
MRRWLAVRPVPRHHAEAADPVNVQAALGAVQGEVLELALEIGFHLEEFDSQHLGVDHERIGAAMPDLDRFIDEVIGLGRLLGDGVDGALEDAALSPSHGRIVGIGVSRS